MPRTSCAALPTPAALAIDFASSLQLRLTGTLTGTGVVAGAAPDNAILTLGPLQVTGTAGTKMRPRPLGPGFWAYLLTTPVTLGGSAESGTVP